MIKNTIKIIVFLILLYVIFALINHDFNITYWTTNEIKDFALIFSALLFGYCTK